jgi:threonine/homoserine/homoserine lactone efflux protein
MPSGPDSEVDGVGDVITEVLPLAIGIAISPTPIIAVILMLLSPQASRTGTGFLIGWVAGIVVATTAVLLLVGEADDAPGSEPSTISSVLKIVIGTMLLLMALVQWLSRPKKGQVAALPRWMSIVNSFTFARAAALGFAMSALNPKNLLMCLGAGTTIGAAHLTAARGVITMAVFTVIAASTVAVPVIGYLSARQKMAGPLNRLHGWLAQNHAIVMAGLLLVIGAALIVKGAAALAA